MTATPSPKRPKKPVPRASSARAAPPRSTARVFWSGRSQAVRLPKEFQLDTTEVLIHREGDRIVLSPVRAKLDAYGWPEGFWSSLGTVDDDFDLGDRAQPHERPDPLGDDGPWRSRTCWTRTR